jgi:hypothetical protein
MPVLPSSELDSYKLNLREYLRLKELIFHRRAAELAEVKIVFVFR